MNSNEKPPKYEEAPPVGHSSTSSSAINTSQRPGSGIEDMVESIGLGDAARRVEGAGDYLRHTLLAHVDRFAGDHVSADEKERLANRGYDQMTTGKREQAGSSLSTPLVTEYYAPEGPMNPGAPPSDMDPDRKDPGIMGEGKV
ncbi:hypothetical protein ABW20_dc0100565 [Dactylellina cionopaga]|nr:hypothetical protein ABW20_dc0100565 [Dactylellina cionopaga]